MTIYIYRGEGVSSNSFQRLVQACANHVPSYAVESIDHLSFFTRRWEESATLIVFPGGRDLPYHHHLQGEGNARIRSFVEKGGRFLGICAGGYYGAAQIEFEKGGELEVCGLRELAFFPGKAVGPAYGNSLFRYEGEQGARGAQIAWEKGTSTIYFHGGCFFEGAERYPTTEILARYNDLPGIPAAAVLCSYGKGSALLSGVHPEYSLNEPFLKYILNKALT